MRRAWGQTGLLIAAAILPLTMTVGTKAQDWKTFKYPSDGFSATFPVAPKEDSREIETPAGTAELHGYTLEVDQAALFIGVCNYGSKADRNDVEAMLEDAKNGALEDSKAKLTRESKILLGRYRGLEFESDGEEMHYITRFYVVGSTMYQTLVVYPLSSPFTDSRRFLDSFQLLGRQQN